MFDRRGFIKILGIMLGLFIARPADLVLAKRLAIGLDKIEKLKSVGESVILKIKGEPILFIRESETTVRALSPICTHKQCMVAYNPEAKRIDCPCHKSAYALDGRVLKGPAEKSLHNFDASLEEGRIVFSMD